MLVLNGVYENNNIIRYTKSILERVCNTHSKSSSTSLSGFDVSMWLQHLVLVPQLCSDGPRSHVHTEGAILAGSAILADSVHGFNLQLWL